MKLIISLIVVIIMIYFAYDKIENAMLSHPSFSSAIKDSIKATKEDEMGMTYNDYMLEKALWEKKLPIDNRDIY